MAIVFDINEIDEILKKIKFDSEINSLVDGDPYVTIGEFRYLESEIYKSELKEIKENPRVIKWKASLSDEDKLLLELGE